MIKAVLFDMDGVVIDSEPLHREAIKKAFKESGIEIKNFDKDYLGKTIPVIIKDILKKHESKEDWEKVLKKRNELILELIPKIDTVKGTISLIDSLNGYKKALATSQIKEVAYSTLDYLKIRDKFDVIITGDDVTKGKPDPEIFLKAAKALETKPEFCLVIEDSRNGVIAAKKAGMKVIAFENPNNPRQDFSQADLIVDDMKKVKIETIRRL